MVSRVFSFGAESSAKSIAGSPTLSQLKFGLHSRKLSRIKKKAISFANSLINVRVAR